VLCCLCKKQNAKVHITQLIGDDPETAKVVERIDLCEACAKEHGVNDPAGFSLADLLTKKKKLLDH